MASVQPPKNPFITNPATRVKKKSRSVTTELVLVIDKLTNDTFDL